MTSLGSSQDSVYIFRIVLRQLENGDVEVSRGSLSANFKMAPDIIIEKREKHSFWKSKSWDEVRHVEHGVTEEDVTRVLSISGKVLGSFDSLSTKSSLPSGDSSQSKLEGGVSTQNLL